MIDPRRSETAAIADEHHFIVPGADAALLLAMIHVLFAEGRVDLGACEGLANGQDAIERIAARFAPERVAARCGIPRRRSGGSLASWPLRLPPPPTGGWARACSASERSPRGRSTCSAS